PVAALLPAHDTPLAPSQVRLGFAIVTGIEDHRPVSKDGEGLQPQVYARFLACLWQGVRRHLGTGDRHVPAICLLRDGDGLGGALNRAGPLHADTSKLGEHQYPMVHRDSIAILCVGDGVVAVASPEAGESSFLTSLPALHPAE